MKRICPSILGLIYNSTSMETTVVAHTETYLRSRVLAKTSQIILNITYSNLPFYQLEFEIKGDMYQLQIFPKFSCC